MNRLGGFELTWATMRSSWLRSTRRLSSSLTVDKATRAVAPIGADGLAVLPQTLPIHNGAKPPVFREGAQMIEVTIDGHAVQIENGSSILQAIESDGINVPRFSPLDVLELVQDGGWLRAVELK